MAMTGFGLAKTRLKLPVAVTPYSRLETAETHEAKRID